MKNKHLALVGAALFTAAAAFAEDVRIMAKTYNTLTESTAKDIPLRDLKLRESGLTPTQFFKDADEIRIINLADTTSRAPEARIWINASQTNAYWFHTGGQGSAENYVVKQGRMIVIHARALTKTIFVPKP